MSNRAGMGATLDELLADLRRVQSEQGYINYHCYEDHGRYSITLVKLRFGSWIKACLAAGVESRSNLVHGVEELLADLRRVSAELGYINQQAYLEHGTFSHQTMRTRFGSWLKACAAAGLESRSSVSRHPAPIETELRKCLGNGPVHTFPAIKADLTHRICDHCRVPTGTNNERWTPCAEGWEVVAG